MFLVTLALLLTPQGVRPLESGLVRSVELAPPPGTMVQYFRLEADDGTGGPLGVGRYVAGPDGSKGFKVELELDYHDLDLRLIQTEHSGPFGRRLVFREVREGGGRTLFLSGTPLEGWDCQELGGPEALRRHYPAGGELPLSLVEGARQGTPVPSEVALFEVLGARFERLRVAATPDSLELRTPDGSLRFAVEFHGRELSALRWQPGAPMARAVTAAEYEALRAAHVAPRPVPASVPR